MTTLQKLQDLEPSTEEFRVAVLTGLSQPRKTLPCKFFYDAEGSRLFDKICELPEYYPTRTECRILENYADEIAAHVGERARLVEFGSGAGIKIRLLLSALERPAAYVPVDISRLHLLAAASSLAKDFPQLAIAPICADYTQPFVVPPVEGSRYTVGFFPGSTIGNFTTEEADRFLTTAHDLLGPDSSIIVGVDLRKDEGVLRRAYDDASGVTAAFNLNLLRRINRELAGTFALDQFVHRAHWNDEAGRMEMYLVSRRAQTVKIGGESFAFKEGEAIHTENSHKYTIAEFQELARSAGYRPKAVWTDEASLFSVHLLRAAGDPQG